MRQSSGVGSGGQAEVCYRLGVEKYPEIRWSWPEFLHAFERRMAEADALAPAIADDYVRLACLEERPGATRVLERDYIEPLRARVAQVCRTPEVTDAALQELRGKLLLPPTPKLSAYRSTGDFRAWLKVVAVRTAIDVARSLGVKEERQLELHDHLGAITLGPEDRIVKEEWRVLVRSALQAALKRLPDSERHALRMNTLAGASIDQIGEVLSVHRATAARWLLAAKDKLRVYLREELAQRVGAGSPELDHLLEELPSRLDVSLSSVFATTGVSA